MECSDISSVLLPPPSPFLVKNKFIPKLAFAGNGLGVKNPENWFNLPVLKSDGFIVESSDGTEGKSTKKLFKIINVQKKIPELSFCE